MKTVLAIVSTLVLVGMGCTGETPWECQEECEAQFAEDIAICTALYWPDQIEDYRECELDAAGIAGECIAECWGTWSESDPAYTLAVDVDWPTVDPLWIEEANTVDLIARDINTSSGYPNVIGAVPFDDIWNSSAWSSFRSTYVYGSLQSSRDTAKFYYVPLEDYVSMSLTDRFDVSITTPWTYVDIDTDDSDGLSVELDTTGMTTGWYVTRVYMVNVTTPASPRIGFGLIQVLDPDD